MGDLTFRYVSAANRQRCSKWHPGFPDGRKRWWQFWKKDLWNGADWSNAMCGEAGEVANVVKKLRRIDTGHPGKVDGGREALLMELANECADTFLYLDLLATYYDIDLPTAIVQKFNAVSAREGFPDRMIVGGAPLRRLRGMRGL